MGEARPPKPVKLIVGMLAQNADWFPAAEQKMAAHFGPVDLASELWPFDFTDYYAAAMGAPLLRRFISFERLIQPDALAPIKLATNAMEAELARELAPPVPRPVNLDPGLLDASKLILATTKDYVHRIYLRDGIYAEVTLTYHKHAWLPTPWTYRDYRTDAYHAFFTLARTRYLGQLKAIGPIGPIGPIGRIGPA
jgi:hypothetical protein